MITVCSLVSLKSVKVYFSRNGEKDNALADDHSEIQVLTDLYFQGCKSGLKSSSMWPGLGKQN